MCVQEFREYADGILETGLGTGLVTAQAAAADDFARLPGAQERAETSEPGLFKARQIFFQRLKGPYGLLPTIHLTPG